ncbi:hypothetical protein Cni_G25798 [Canna indica]|uniref:Reverse transcriptase domain-containing protein n=1 Tax=Canna indica TaxID=4628 RepID=A0AAQ3QQS0_9LILI|nr:hypothetical protein Cni_G25798 [Canna indica]
MKFHEIVRKWLQACLSSAMFFCSINGQKSSGFTSKKGVRQGDPLSPYIFIIMQDMLSRILNKFSENGYIKCFNYKGMKLSHLAFADDILIVIKGNLKNCSNVMKAISLYCSLTDQRINNAKSKFTSLCSARTI